MSLQAVATSQIALGKVAERAGLEPAAFRVTGGRYNQLN